MDVTRKNLLYYEPRQQWWKDTLENLLNSGWIYQFTSIPQNSMGRDRKYWMERIHKELYQRKR